MLKKGILFIYFFETQFHAHTQKNYAHDVIVLIIHA